MSQPFLAAAVVALGSTLAAAAAATPQEAVDRFMPQQKASVGFDCLGEPSTWLPGTLQTHGKSAVTDSSSTANRSAPDRSTSDCALA
ncbi:hypothetical protein [Pelagibius sp.]|uniref:hypothetical protein n=1 Tax=Pelagibius sp. TaxID=1931238 RepID=UPI00262353BF|nr:hypothetical protein [Pelagibius sp.]